MIISLLFNLFCNYCFETWTNQLLWDMNLNLHLNAYHSPTMTCWRLLRLPMQGRQARKTIFPSQIVSVSLLIMNWLLSILTKLPMIFWALQLNKKKCLLSFIFSDYVVARPVDSIVMSWCMDNGWTPRTLRSMTHQLLSIRIQSHQKYQTSWLRIANWSTGLMDPWTKWWSFELYWW